MKADNTLTIDKIGDNIDSTTYSINVNDTIDTIDMSSLTAGTFQYSTPSVTIGTSSGSNGTWGIGAMGSNGYSSSPYIFTTDNTSGLHVNGTADFEGDVRIKGRSLEKMLTKIEDRLAILSEPDPEKLEKFAALKKAYDNYKMLERLIGDHSDTESEK